MKKVSAAKASVQQVHKADLKLMAQEAYDNGFKAGAKLAKDHWGEVIKKNEREATKDFAGALVVGFVFGACVGACVMMVWS